MTVEQWNQSHPKGHIMQADCWAELKNNWEHRVLTAEREGELVGSVSVLIRKLPIVPVTMMYAPRGPVCDPHDEDAITQLTEKLRVLAKEKKAYVFKVDPDVPSDDKEFTDILRRLGYRIKEESKNFEGIQPRFVFRLNVEGKTEDEVFALFHSKTRYNIRVAIKKGVTVELGKREDLARFHEIMVETGLRDEFVIRSLDYFERMYDVLGENCRLYLARHEGKIIAGTLALCYGDKVWYLYGASSNESRNVMPNYLLQWEMIRWAIERGCRIYDFRGVSGDLSEDNPLYGLYRFKKGFNGDFVEFVGEAELVFKPFWAFMVDKALPVFMNLRKKLFLRKK